MTDTKQGQLHSDALSFSNMCHSYPGSALAGSLLRTYNWGGTGPLLPGVSQCGDRESSPQITATLIMLTVTPTAASHALAGGKNAAEKLHLD